MNPGKGPKIQFISAGAGSGKTFSLTQKLQALLSNGSVMPAGVLATTYTKLAAAELKERVRSALIDSGQLQVANQMEQALIGTVNGICGELLRRFAFEAGMPPEQQVLEEKHGDMLFYQAMERAMSTDNSLTRQMNNVCHRLQILDASQQLNWRAEVKKIADAARANNQLPDTIRAQGKASADTLLTHFPEAATRDLDRLLLNALEHAIENIDTDTDNTKLTRDYLALISGIRAGIYKERATWAEWISLSKKMPGSKSKVFAKPIVCIAAEYEKHPRLHADLRFFAEQAFRIAAASLHAYQQLKTEKGLIDFVDQEQRLYQLLDNPTVQETLRQELQLLMVDEFQDTSPIQLALFLKLSQLAKQVIWVGDIKQSIYGFRGSDPTLMSAVVQRITVAGNEPEILEQSWRSTPELVAYINNLFAPAFAETLLPKEVCLKSARNSLRTEAAIETWRLTGNNKSERAAALATGIRTMIAGGRTVIDKQTAQAREVCFGDIAVLCRTHSNLDALATALSAASIPIRYQRSGLLATPEGCLAIACLRQLIDPTDTLASAEILTLAECKDPEEWLAARLALLQNPNACSRKWLENEPDGPVAALQAQRDRLPFLTPVEVLRTAIDAAGVRKSVYHWGPTEQRSQHRLNNLSMLLHHAENYMDQCAAQHQPASAAGLVLWLYQLADTAADTQANGSTENAVQLVTHHGAKGLEWPVVIAMDLSAELKPRVWGLSVLPSPTEIRLEAPLANRTLRYWPAFNGSQRVNIPLLDKIAQSAAGQQAMKQEVEEAKRLLYVSLTRPRDALIIAMASNKTQGPWMQTLAAEWMLPANETLLLPDGTAIPSKQIELAAAPATQQLQEFKPIWLTPKHTEETLLPLRLQPSSCAPLAAARIGDVIVLGRQLEITGDCEPRTLGAALHAVIATSLFGQNDTARVLHTYQVASHLDPETAEHCSSRLLATIRERFNPLALHAEYPVRYRNDCGQLVSGWIDLLLETDAGFILIDHKVSPRATADWKSVALTYSGQLHAYAAGVERATGRPVTSRWIHFAVSAALVQIC